MVIKAKPILYISGPFSSDDNLHGVEFNILTASVFALDAWVNGWAVICPHKNTSGFQHVPNIPYDTWISGDLEFIERMRPDKGDALLMLPDWEKSNGAVIEHRYAEVSGLNIYYAKDGVPIAAKILK